MNQPQMIAARRPMPWLSSPISALPAIDRHYVMGLLVAALAPSLFWTALLKGAAVLLGFSAGWPLLVAVGLSIFTFLTGIYTCVIRRF